MLIQKSIHIQTMASMTNSRYASILFTDKKPTEPAIVIPRVFKNITQQRILAVFGKLDLGDIVRIDMVPRTNDLGEEYWRVFVHLAWADTENGTAVRDRLLSTDGDNRVKIVYDDPWFWKIHAYCPAPEKNNVRRSRPAPFIDFSTNMSSIDGDGNPITLGNGQFLRTDIELLDTCSTEEIEGSSEKLSPPPTFSQLERHINWHA